MHAIRQSDASIAALQQAPPHLSANALAAVLGANPAMLERPSSRRPRDPELADQPADSNAEPESAAVPAPPTVAAMSWQHLGEEVDSLQAAQDSPKEAAPSESSGRAAETWRRSAECGSSSPPAPPAAADGSTVDCAAAVAAAAAAAEAAATVSQPAASGDPEAAATAEAAALTSTAAAAGNCIAALPGAPLSPASCMAMTHQDIHDRAEPVGLHA